ncbi:NUDIX domain-containing protein [Sporolactobacillus shoreae]|uniref:NUDIX domain-containing protein n=1 Tax=Sporolactobacillus shoreae TaxID=1465501 RepID=UPI001432C6D3
MEPGESDEQCLRRELLEETGCAIDQIYLGHACNYFFSLLPVRRPMLGSSQRFQAPDVSRASSVGGRTSASEYIPFFINCGIQR